MDRLEQEQFRIYALQDGAMRSQALAFCLRSGLFEMLSRGPRSYGEICTELGLAERVAPAVLAFLGSQQLVRRDEEGRFANTEAAQVFLVRSSPRYVGGRALLFAGFHEAAGHLAESLASGRPWTGAGQHDMFAGFGEEDQRWFADGMFANAAHGALALMETVDLGLSRRLLDVGGGAGGYAIAIARAHPGLRATIFDLPALGPLAAERIGRAGLTDRVEFVAGSFFVDPLPPGHDALLLSSVLHDWDDDDCRRILRRCHAALEPGGLAIVTEPMLAEDLTGPDHPSVSGLTMAVLGGENRTRERIAAMLLEAGFVDTWASPLGPQNSTVTARRQG